MQKLHSKKRILFKNKYQINKKRSLSHAIGHGKDSTLLNDSDTTPQPLSITAMENREGEEDKKTKEKKKKKSKSKIELDLRQKQLIMH